MLWWFAQTTLISGALVVLVGLATRWKRLGPEARHALWLVVLIKFAIPPFVAWPWGLADAWPIARIEPAPAPAPAPALAVAVAPAPALVVAPTPDRDRDPDPATMPTPIVSVAAPAIEADEPAPGSPPPPIALMTDNSPPVDVVESAPVLLETAPVPPAVKVPAVALPLEPPVEVARADPIVPPLEIRTPADASAGLLAPAGLSGIETGRLGIIDHGPSVLLGVWLAGTVVVVVRRAVKVIRFHRALAQAEAAPDWLVEEARAIGERVGVRVPRIVATSGVGTPLLWCLGAPRLILPTALINRLEADRWPGILAHELAHLARRDHWVVRLELLVEAVWWWNPLFWHTRRRLHEEAEQACDARVIRTLPDRRLAYAEALVDVCEHLARTAIPSPSLGVGGAGLGASRSLEGRLLMILRDPIPRRPSRRGALAAVLLAVLALPAWTLGQQPEKPKTEPTTTTTTPITPPPVPKPVEAPPEEPSKPAEPLKAASLSIDEIRIGFQQRVAAIENVAMRYVVASRSESTAGPTRQRRVQIEAADLLYEIPGPTRNIALITQTRSRLNVFEAKPGSPPQLAEALPATNWARWLEIRTDDSVKSLRASSSEKGSALFRWQALGRQFPVSRSSTIGSMFTRDSSLLAGTIAASVPTENTPAHRPLVTLDLEGPTPAILAAWVTQANVTGTETIEGREAVRVAWVSLGSGEARGICWFVPSLDFAVIRSDAFIDGPREAIKPDVRWVWRKTASDFKQVDEIWLPGKVTTRLSEVDLEGKATVVREQVVILENYQVNADLPETAFEANFPIQALDEKTGDFTTTPPEPPAGLVDRLVRAVRESPYGPPLNEKTTEAPKAALAQPTPYGPPSARVQPAVAADPLPVAEAPKPAPAANPSGGDLEAQISRRFSSDPEVIELAGKISSASDRLEKMRRLMTTVNDPALATAQKGLDALKSQYSQAWASKSKQLRETLGPLGIQLRDEVDLLQIRRERKAIEVRKAEAIRDLARAVADNNERLRKTSVVNISQAEVTRSQGELKVAEAEVASKQSELDEADLILKQAKRRFGEPTSMKPEINLDTLLARRKDAAAELQKTKDQVDQTKANTTRTLAQINTGKIDVFDSSAITRLEKELAADEARLASHQAALDEVDLLLSQARRQPIVNPRWPAATDPNRPDPRAEVALLQVRRDGKAAELQQAETRGEIARIDANRSAILWKRNAIKRPEVDQANKDLQATLAEVPQKKAELDQAESLLDQAKKRLELPEAANPKGDSSKSSMTLTELRDAIELLEVQIKGKQAEQRQAEIKVGLATKQSKFINELVAKKAVGADQEAQASAELDTANAQLDGKKAEVLEFEVRLKQARRRAEAEEARTRLDSPSLPIKKGEIPQQSDNPAPKADVRVQLSGQKDRISGQAIDYQVKVCNYAVTPAINVQVVAALPTQGGKLRNLPTDAKFSTSDRTLTWSIPRIEPGFVANLSFTYDTSTPGAYRATVKTVMDENRSTDSMTTNVSGIAVLDLRVTQTARVIEVGKSNFYDVTIKNLGSKDASQLKITGVLTKNLKVIKHFNVEKGDFQFNPETSRFLFPEINSLAVGQSITLSIEVQATGPGPADCRIALDHAGMVAGEAAVEDLVTTTVTPAALVR